MTIRSPAVAGMFYPAAPDALDRVVRAALAAARVDAVPAKAIVAPHAGYVYSGLIAGSAFRSVAHLADRITRIVLLGPSHRCRFAGIAVPSATGFATPLGTIAVDRAACDRALALPEVHLFDQAFDGEHALEVELPFIQVLWPQAAVVPLIVGEASAEAVAAVFEALWGGEETLIVISSDLSHYHDYEAALALDLGTSQAIEAIMPGKLTGSTACGHRALAGLLRQAARHDLRATTRDLRNSGDTRGPRDRVVGYGAYTFEQALEASLSERHRRELIEAAYATLRHIAAKGSPPNVSVASFPLPLRALRKTFVTIELDGRVRGCIGTLAPVNPLISDIVTNTYKAAMKDPRFRPMTPEELASAEVSISILSHMRPLTFASESELLDRLRPAVDGLAIRDGSRQSIFLPKVWSELPDPPEFLGHLKRKAGLTAQLSPAAQAFRFTAETFGR